NYGVMYAVEIELAHPLPEEHVALLALAPRAGWARGAFLIDGWLVETGAATLPQEVCLAQFRLQAGETRRVTVATLPCGGSSYPVWLVARSGAAAGRAPTGGGRRPAGFRGWGRAGVGPPGWGVWALRRPHPPAPRPRPPPARA